jgi:hypothetical protein
VNAVGGVLDAGLTTSAHKDHVGISFTDYFVNRQPVLATILQMPVTAPLPLTQSYHLLHSQVTYGDFNRKGFSGAFGTDYNLAQKINQHVVAQGSYNFGCFAIEAEYMRINLGPTIRLRNENTFRIALALANVGTFGNLKPRERLY